MHNTEIHSSEELETLIREQTGVLAYFSTPECGVCKVIRPQIEGLLARSYPNMVFAYVDVARDADIGAQRDVLTVPTLVLYFEGHENQRFVRNFSLSQVEGAIRRPYEMLFS